MRKDCPKMSTNDILLAAVKMLNSGTGPDGLVPTLLVFGAMTRFGTSADPPNQNTHKRAAAFAKATNYMSTYFTKRQVKEASKQRNAQALKDRAQGLLT